MQWIVDTRKVDTPGPSRYYQDIIKDSHVLFIKRLEAYESRYDPEIRNLYFEDFYKLENLDLDALSSKYREPNYTMQSALHGFNKYNVPQPKLEDDVWESASDMTERMYLPYMRNSNIMSVEAVWAEINKNTSCGTFLSEKYRNKKDLYDKEGLERFNWFWDNYKKCTPIWKNSLKSELRSIEKFSAIDGKFDKIRVFTASPVDLTIFEDMLFLDQNQKFYESHLKTWSCVGLSKYAGGFQKMKRKFKFKNYLSLDGKAYDSCLHNKHSDKNYKLRLRALNGSKLKDIIERVQYAEYHNKFSYVLLPTGDIVQKTTGNPSGCVNTVVDNTIGLTRLVFYIILKIAKEKGIEITYEDIMDNVIGFIYGDDVLLNISDEWMTWLNPSSFIKESTLAGQPFESEDGSEDWVKEEDLFFLGHNFVQDQFYTFPAPKTDKILSSLRFGSCHPQIQMHYLRANALRMESWANKQCRSILQKYIEFLEKNFNKRIFQTFNLKNGETITENQLRSAYKDDYFCFCLYTGVESSAGNTREEALSLLKYI